MKAFLMFKDKDFNRSAEPSFERNDLMSDFELEYLLDTMAADDTTIYDACEAAIFQPLQDMDEITYRQQNLCDALEFPEAVRELYQITVETEKERKNSWHWLSGIYLSSTFSNAVALLKLYTDMLMKLREIADKNADHFQSEGFRNLFLLLQRELSDDYFDEVKEQLSELRNRDGTLISSRFGSYLQGVHYVFRRKQKKGFLRRWYFTPSYTIAERDEVGATDLEKRRDRAINEATNALAQATEHLEHFFAMLRGELAFYVGCLNLARELQERKRPFCIPDLLPMGSRDRSWNGLYDISLALSRDDEIIGNTLEAKAKELYIITGANQGGKSTFLRSVGQAQLMAQCGMFVGAVSLRAPIRCRIFSHFKKEEDAGMKSGKLDEELVRMDKIANHIHEDSMILFNESFAATNEREGSEICRQITQALVDNGVEVFSVTHLYTYASSFQEYHNTQFLRAERLDSGDRTFRIIPGDPLQTAFGEDLYHRIFDQNEVAI